jgi:hypothetical protein
MMMPPMMDVSDEPKEYGIVLRNLGQDEASGKSCDHTEHQT